jgi:hypothetical protein
VDFVIAGILLGSLAVVAGELFRIFGPRRTPAERKSLRRGADPAHTPRAWTSACHAIGLLATTAGAFLLLVTMLLTLIGVSDSIGWIGVGVVGLVGTIVTLAGSWSILNHYRTGGFDPVLQSERPVIAAKRQRAQSQAVRDELFDDGEGAVEIVRSAPATAWTEVTEAPPAVGEHQDQAAGLFPDAPVEAGDTEEIEDPAPIEVVDTSEDEDLAGPDPEPVPEPRPVAAPIQPKARIVEEPVRREPTPSPRDDWRSRAPEPPVQQQVQRLAADPAPEPSQSGVPPVAQPSVPDYATPNFELPLIDLDDELPAWNAAPAEPTPPVQRSGPRSGARPIERPTGQVVDADSELEIPDPSPGGFKSSLFADIAPDAEQHGSGRHFSSKLLNELTSDLGPPKPADDIVLDEFSLPAEPRPDKRDRSPDS